MKNIVLACVMAFVAGAGSVSAEEGFVPLFNGKDLSGWTSAHSTGKGDWGPFRIDRMERAIHVYKGEKADSEQPSDCLVSDKTFSKFILRMEYKWLDKRFVPRAKDDRDAGLLFHVHGDLTRVWPLSMEMQIGETPGHKMEDPRFHTGDLFVLGETLQCKVTRTEQMYDPKAPVVTSSHCKTPLGVEKPMGEWNEIEIEVHGADKAVFKLNGEVVFVLTEMTHEVDGKRVPLSEGRIAVQAEWAELLYRNIRIKEL